MSDLRTALAEAYSRSEAGETNQVEAPVVEQQEEFTPQVTDSELVTDEGSGRDEKGRFIAKAEPEAKPDKAAEAVQPDPAAAVADPAQQAAPDAQEQPTRRAPGSWKPEIQKQFNTLPAPVQEEILRRESDAQRAINSYVPMAKEGQNYRQATEPYAARLQELGVDGPTAVAKLFQTDHMLRHGPDEAKIQLFSQMARDYGIDPAKLVPMAPVDPNVLAMQRELMQTRNQMRDLQQEQQQVQMTGFQRQIDAFAADPANHLFQTVSGDMATLLERGLATDLQDAYEKAVWGRSDTRQMMVDQERTKAQQAAVQGSTAQRAKKAAVSVKGSSPAGAGTRSPKNSLREELSAAMDEAGFA